MEDAVVTRWDRARWISVFSSHNPTIREVTECLGLGLSASSSTTNRGIPKFDNPDYRKLSSEVTKLSKELPKERDALLDFAADPQSLVKELDELLATFGPAIWGRDTDRACLLTPEDGKKTYPRDLYYEEPADKEVLKIHLHRWIIIKACYYIRNMKLKRSSVPGEYETIADLETEGAAASPKPQLAVKLPIPPSKLQAILSPPQSPNGTPQSTTPAPLEHAAGSANMRKRKSSAHLSMSDGEDGHPAKRQYQSATMPTQRKSPRKSLKSVSEGSPSTENIPPSQIENQSHHVQPGHVPTPDGPRPLLSPLTSNDLNGASRPASVAPPFSGFTPVNTGSFTAVNTASPQPPTASHSAAPPVQNAVPSQRASPLAQHKTPPVQHATPPVQQSAPPAQNGAPALNGTVHPGTASTSHGTPMNHSYSSPYGQPTTQNGSSAPTPAPHVAPIATHSFQAINSATTNGNSARNSPVIQNPTHSHVMPQPPSRSHTPVTHSTAHSAAGYHHHGRSNTPTANSSHHTNIAPRPSSRSHTPIVAPAPHVQAPAVQSIHQPVMQYAPPPQAILKSHSVDTSRQSVHTANGYDITLLQCEVLGALMQYFFPKPTTPPDETALLQRLEYLWAHNAASFQQQLGPLYSLQSKVLNAWISERRKISQLRHSLSLAPGVAAAEMADRLLAMNDLRVMRLKWKNMSSQDGSSPEDLLCSAFAVITNTEGTEYLFKDGLERLNEGVFKFLKSEDMKISIQQR